MTAASTPGTPGAPAVTIDAIETPALLIDLDALEHNIAVMAGYLRGKHARLRPHFKTHKCLEICRLQLAAGAVGIACAKLSEAEVLAAGGIPDILIANEVVDPAKIARLAGLARAATLRVCVDDAANVDELSAAASRQDSTIGVLVEVDVGMHRCGVVTAGEALALAERIARSPGLRFDGVQAYEGHIVASPDPHVRRSGVREMTGKIEGVRALIEGRGLDVRLVSGGGTGTFDLTGAGSTWNEIQAGSYVFMDTAYARLGLPFTPSLSVLATVLHTHPGRAVTDAGMKVCSTDHGQPAVKGHPECQVRLNEEHGLVEDPGAVLARLQRIEYLPSHGCTTANLHDRYHCVRAGRLEAVWQVAGRGKSQ